MVSSWNSDSVSIFLALLFQRIEEIEHRGRKHLVMGAGAEIDFGAAMQGSVKNCRPKKRDLVALADLADSNRHRALIGADDGADFFLGMRRSASARPFADRPDVGERRGAPWRRRGGQAPRLRQRQLEIVILVDQVGRGLERPSADRPICALAPDSG